MLPQDSLGALSSNKHTVKTKTLLIGVFFSSRQAFPTSFLSRGPLALQLLAHIYCIYTILIIIMYESIVISMLSRTTEIGRVENLEELAYNPRFKDLKVNVLGGSSPNMVYLKGHPVYPALEDRLEPVSYQDLPNV